MVLKNYQTGTIVKYGQKCAQITDINSVGNNNYKIIHCPSQSVSKQTSILNQNNINQVVPEKQFDLQGYTKYFIKRKFGHNEQQI